MSEYITKASAVSVLLYNQDEYCSAVISEMEDIPCEDVAPMVHGKWIIPHWRNSTYCAYCSVCGEEAQHGEYKGVQKYYKFCPYCGARMDVEQKELKGKTNDICASGPFVS